MPEQSQPPPVSCVHVVLSFLLMGVALLTGCKREAANPTVMATNATVTLGAPQTATVPVSRQAQAINAGASADEVLGQLTSELRRYVAYKRQIPKSFEEFAANNSITIPPPPAGKKYAIAEGKVVLVND